MDKKIMFCLFLIFTVMNATLLAQPQKLDSPIPKRDIKIDFRVKWDGRMIPGITQVSGLRRKTEVVEHRAAGDPSLKRRSPGVNEYQPIVLKRPRSKDKEFERWADKAWNYGAGLGSEVSLRDFRKDILIELCEGSGRVIMAFKVYRCWPSDYIALSGLDADEDTPAMEILTLEHEGWERDNSIP